MNVVATQELCCSTAKLAHRLPVCRVSLVSHVYRCFSFLLLFDTKVRLTPTVFGG